MTFFSKVKNIKLFQIFLLILICLGVFTGAANAQKRTKPAAAKKPGTSKKAEPKPEVKPAPPVKKSEPFEKATLETMAKQCIRLETEAGNIEIKLLPEAAPETVRNFLNLTALGAFDTTTFSRVVPGFVVQGGNISTREKTTPELDERASKTIPDEPNAVKHERGIVSMARPETPNSATSHFFILIGSAPHLDGTFTAFGRVTSGMDVVDLINKMPVENEKPLKPVRISKAAVFQCPVQQ